MLADFFKSFICSQSHHHRSQKPSDHYETISYNIPPPETSTIPSKRRKYLALDLDGTLVYTRTLHFEGAEPIIVNSFLLSSRLTLEIRFPNYTVL